MRLFLNLSAAHTPSDFALGQADIGLRSRLGEGQLNLGLLNALLGNQQFYDTMGWDMGKWESILNQSLIGQMLG